MTHNMNISMGDFAFLLHCARRPSSRWGPEEAARHRRLEDEYRQEAFQARGTSPRLTLTERQKRNAERVLDDDRSVGTMRATRYIPFEKPTHYAVVVDNLSAPPVTITSDKEVALETARIFNYAQQVHPEGAAYAASVYAYGPGTTKGTIVTR